MTRKATQPSCESSSVDIPKAFKPLFKPARYKVFYGGRGGAKSWAFAIALLVLAAQRKMRILCARELQISIADSVHHLLKEQIERIPALRAFYEVQQNTIKGRNGSTFIFSGLKSNITKIKSMEALDVVWVEEAQTVSDDSWATLIPTVRKPDSEIWASYNPDLEDDPTHQRFAVDPPPGAVVVKVGWQDNPWFPDVLRDEMEYLRSVDPEAAAHVWDGECRKNSVAQVLRGRYRVESFKPSKKWCGPYYGADWGFANDPTTLIRCWVDERTLYVDQEAYEVGCDLDNIPKLFDAVADARKHTIRADNARPETIRHMQTRGYSKVIACDKWPGSVEDGVEHLRSYEKIVIHPRCEHTAEEARLWSYKVDKLSGDVMPKLLDKHDHCWDAIRYALGPIIMAGKNKKPDGKPKKPPSKWDKAFAKKPTGGWKTA